MNATLPGAAAAVETTESLEPEVSTKQMNRLIWLSVSVGFLFGVILMGVLQDWKDQNRIYVNTSVSLQFQEPTAASNSTLPQPGN